MNIITEAEVTDDDTDWSDDDLEDSLSSRHMSHQMIGYVIPPWLMPDNSHGPQES